MKQDRASEIGEYLPFLRRYARATTGSQQAGDDSVAALLNAILSDNLTIDAKLPLRIALFRALYEVPFLTKTSTEQGKDTIADKRLAELGSPERAALVLHTIEEMSLEDVASVISVNIGDAEELIEKGRASLSENIAGRVMIIEDEALIAMDLQALVTSQGHNVTGIARTHESAVKMGLEERPDLILADIQLADQSSGVDAVHDLLEKSGEIPVIFITAFPEILLTGKRPEPAFLITKPYTQEQVHSAVSQAMFFASSKGIQPPS